MIPVLVSRDFFAEEFMRESDLSELRTGRLIVVGNCRTVGIVGRYRYVGGGACRTNLDDAACAAYTASIAADCDDDTLR